MSETDWIKRESERLAPKSGECSCLALSWEKHEPSCPLYVDVAAFTARIVALECALEDAAITMRNYYAGAISRAVVDEKLERYRELCKH